MKRRDFFKKVAEVAAGAVACVAGFKAATPAAKPKGIPGCQIGSIGGFSVYESPIEGICDPLSYVGTDRISLNAIREAKARLRLETTGPHARNICSGLFEYDRLSAAEAQLIKKHPEYAVAWGWPPRAT